MNLTTRMSLTHTVGAVVLLASLGGGFRLALRPAMEARAQSVVLEQRLLQQRDELRGLPSVDPARSEHADPPVVNEPPAQPKPTPPRTTPTGFLSSFESLARRIGLRVESSKELQPSAPSSEPAADGLRFEITGTGTFEQLVGLCDALPEPLPGLEIRSLRINRGAGEQVRWTVVCRNHDGRAE